MVHAPLVPYTISVRDRVLLAAGLVASVLLAGCGSPPPNSTQTQDTNRIHVNGWSNQAQEPLRACMGIPETQQDYYDLDCWEMPDKTNERGATQSVQCRTANDPATLRVQVTTTDRTLLYDEAHQAPCGPTDTPGIELAVDGNYNVTVQVTNQ